MRFYEHPLAAAGFGIAEARPSIELAYAIRHAPISAPAQGAPFPGLGGADYVGADAMSERVRELPSARIHESVYVEVSAEIGAGTTVRHSATSMLVRVSGGTVCSARTST